MASIEKLPPHSVEAEEATLGGLLIDPGMINSYRNFLGPDDFYREKNGWIYSAALSLWTKSEPIDFLTICDELDNREQLDGVGGPAFITGLINAVPTTIHAEHYAKMVVSLANRRRLIDAAGRMARAAYQNEDDLAAYTEALHLVKAASPTGRPVETTGEDLAGDILKALVEVAEDNQEDGRYEALWPWPSMQRMARWRRGQPAGLIAEGGAGKTAFCMEVAFFNAQNGGNIFYVATEDEPNLLLLRRLATMSGVRFREIETGKYRWEDARGQAIKSVETEALGVKLKLPVAVVRAIQSTNKWRGKIRIVSGMNRTVPEILHALERLELETGTPDAVIFDWFLDQKERDGKENIVNKLMADLRDLKEYSKGRTRLLIATQTGKVGSGKSRLTATDAYFTSSFAHYGKLVFSIKREREEVNGERVGPFKPEMEIFISKANLDLTGSFKLAMRGETFAVYEPGGPDEPN